MTQLDDVFGDGNPHKDTGPDSHGLAVSDAIPATMTTKEWEALDWVPLKPIASFLGPY
jgi:hypothetical protein